jgi:uncharacterized protein
MAIPEDLTFDPNSFAGTARLFPLPNHVLFPHVMQPLHIFEPRYRALMEEAAATDQYMALALFAPGWEKDYEGRPPLQPMACLGRIATYQRMPEDRFNLLLLGVKRVRILHELPPDKPFREAEVEICEDIYSSATAPTRPGLQKQLVDSFKAILPTLSDAQEQVDELLGRNVPLGVLTDIVSYTLDLGMPLKEQLLHECNVDRRASLLVDYLQKGGKVRALGRTGFPPEFSIN